MKHILSKQSQRFLTTLEHLYYNDYSSHENLANLSQVSVKTIQEDIKKMNDFINPLKINNYFQNECRLVGQNNIASDYIYSCILSNSLEFSVLEIIFFEKHDRLEDYADALFISLSTLKRIISKINNRIKKNGFQISTNPIQLVGDEQIICYMMANFFKEKYLEEKYPFSPVQYKVFDQLFYYALSDYQQFSNFPDINKLKLYCFVSIIRIQNGHFEKTTFEKKLKKNYEFSFLDNHLFKQAFKSVFQIELSKENIIDLAYPFLNENFAFSYNEMLEVTNKNERKKRELDNLILLIEDISSSLDLTLVDNKRKKLILDLYNVRLLMVEHPNLLHNVKRNFLINLMNDYPVVYKFVESKIINHPNFKEYSESEKEEIIYILLTHWNELLFAIQDTQPLFTVGLCMTADVEHSELIANMLNRKFYRRFDFQVIQFTNYQDASDQFDNYDVILTNVSNMVYKDKTIVCIDLYPSMKDYTKIYNLYYDLQEI